MEIILDPAAFEEYLALAGREQDAIDNVIAKLEAMGDRLGYPHTSAVKGSDRLRELRPRAGHSAWRALYRRVGEVAVVGAFGLDATVDQRGFTAACRLAEERLAAYEMKGRDQ